MKPLCIQYRAGAFALGHFVFVVGEKQVLAAAVNVEGFAQVFHAHGGAFDVPAGTAHAPGGFPGGLARLLGFPEGEVGGVLFHLVHVDARTGLQVVQVLAGQLAVAHVLLGVKVHVAVHLVGVALVLQGFHQMDDFADVLRGPGMHRGGTDAQGLGVLIVFLNEPVAQLLHGDAFLVGALDHLVVDVGEVLHEGDFIAPVLKVPPQHVKGDEGPGVADVEIIVHRGAAGVNAHLAGMQGHEFFLFSCCAVVNLHFISLLVGCW